MSAVTNSLFTQSAATSSGTAGGGPPTSDQLTSEQTFLQLLIAQMKNQDPTNPTDPVQFVGQLTQYSELEQLIGINKGVNTLTKPSSDAGTAATSGTNKTT